jgi:hypothetical protein
MKQTTFLLMLTFFTLILTGCQEKTVSKKSSNSNNSSANCSGQAYWTTPGCIGYCQNSPGSYGCGSTTSGTTGSTTGGTTGTTTGGTTGGTTGTGVCASNPSLPYCSPNYCSPNPKPYGCLSNGSNCYLNQTAYGCGGSAAAVPANPYWGVKYPPSGSAPSGSCSASYVPSGQTTTLETRKGTITINGKGRNSGDPITEYAPFHTDAPNYQNTTDLLKSVPQAKLFFLTDSVLKFRVKINPEPDSSGTSQNVCYGRNSGTYLAGYTKLQYAVKVYGVNANNGFSYLGTLGPYTTNVNNCSPAIDLSAYQESSPNGIMVAIYDVKENKNCSPWNWDANGWNNCSNFNKIRSMECWSMDFEVAADGTKTFD